MKLYNILILILISSISSIEEASNQLKLSNQIQLFTQYAGATYCSKNKLLESWKCPFHCEQLTLETEVIEIIENKELDIKGVFLYNKEQNLNILSFRGSNSLVNWKLNGMDKLVPLKIANSTKVLVHEGFQVAFLSVREKYLKCLKIYFKNNKVEDNLYILGHSLGGAIANLAALDIVNELKIIPKVVTFGQPRIGNKQFVNYYTHKIPSTIRAINGNDPVPILNSIEKGYVHNPREMHFDNLNEKNSKLIMCSDKDGEDKIGINSKFPFVAKDHFQLLGIPFDNLCDEDNKPLNQPLYNITDKVNALIMEKLKYQTTKM